MYVLNNSMKLYIYSIKIRNALSFLCQLPVTLRSGQNLQDSNVNKKKYRLSVYKLEMSSILGRVSVKFTKLRRVMSTGKGTDC